MWAHGWGSKRHRGLRVWVLQLLDRGPMNGAEIMEEMDKMTLGWWRPSPGSIYPLLDQLAEEKLVQKRADGRYELTDSARAGPDWTRGWGPRSGPRNPQEAVAEMEAYVTFLEDLARGGKTDLAPLSERFRSVAQRLTALGSLAVSGRSA